MKESWSDKDVLILLVGLPDHQRRLHTFHAYDNVVIGSIWRDHANEASVRVSKAQSIAELTKCLRKFLRQSSLKPYVTVEPPIILDYLLLCEGISSKLRVSGFDAIKNRLAVLCSATGV